MGRILPSMANVRAGLTAESTLMRFPTPTKGDFERVQSAVRAERMVERENDHLNAHVRARHLCMSRPEPKSIHDPAPSGPIRFEPPKKRTLPTPASRDDGTIPYRDPEKRHPYTKLEPHLNRFYGK